ncbi:hypothetical protein EQM14_01150 [Caproiciproducens sp. NJN-50]|uniref:hypothetical protein n=1 Tax=Acutalibacteraceae TaxID=3082771 RepID=UPI000FFE0074|nr:MULTISPECIES: hypothetical protein [Acutalibacteraceae]QAT48493.1 hypothetical protein EQM14_01150 [Caproiciproducens sp. NJN-50]
MKKKQIVVFSVAAILLALVEFMTQWVRTWSIAMGQPYADKSMPKSIYQKMHLLGRLNQIGEVGWRVLFFLFLCYIGWLIVHEFIAFHYAALGTFCPLIFSMLIHFAFQPYLSVVLLDYAARLAFTVIWLFLLEGSQIIWRKIRPI